MMKRLSLTLLCCVLLSGCILDPVFDTSSWVAYQTSFAAIQAKLGNDDLRRLQVALRYLMVESMPTGSGGQLLDSGTAAGMFTNPVIILARLGPQINGRSAENIIQGLSSRLDAEISEAEARLQGSRNVLGSVEVNSPRYYWRQSGNFQQPVIEFSVRNNGQIPISRAYFNVVLTTPNRTIPWARQEFVQTFTGGLEPREKQDLTLQPRLSDWSDPKLKYLADAELKVTVVNFDDANSENMLVVDRNSLELKRKVRDMLR